MRLNHWTTVIPIYIWRSAKLAAVPYKVLIVFAIDFVIWTMLTRISAAEWYIQSSYSCLLYTEIILFNYLSLLVDVFCFGQMAWSSPPRAVSKFSNLLSKISILWQSFGQYPERLVNNCSLLWLITTVIFYWLLRCTTMDYNTYLSVWKGARVWYRLIYIIGANLVFLWRIVCPMETQLQILCCFEKTTPN